MCRLLSFLLALAISVSVWAASRDDLFASAQEAYDKGLYQAAADLFDRYIWEYPLDERTPRARVLKVKSYLHDDRFRAARITAEALSDEALRLYLLGLVEFNQQHYTEAFNYFDRFTSSYPDNPYRYEVYAAKADALYDMGRFRDASVLYRRILEDKDLIMDAGMLANVYYGLGWCHVKLGERDTAFETFGELAASSSDPDIRLKAQLSIADASLEVGDVERASRLYSELATACPESVYADYIGLQVGLCHLRMGRFAAAVTAFDRMEKRFPQTKLRDEVMYYKALAWFLGGEHELALDAVKSFVQYFPRSAHYKDVYILLVQIHSRMGHVDQALQICRELRERYPADAGFLTRIGFQEGVVHMENGVSDKAVDAFERMLREYPGSAYAEQALFYISRIRSEQGQLLKAEESFRDLHQVYPDSPHLPEIRMDIARLYWHDGKQEQAQALLDENIRFADSDAAFRSNLLLAQLMIDSGQYDRAHPAFDTMVKRFPEHAGEVLYHQGRLYESQSSYKQAFDCYDSALSNGFDSEDLRFKRALMLEKIGEFERAVQSYFDVVYQHAQGQEYLVKSYLRIAQIYERQKLMDKARTIYHAVSRMDVAESKYADERLRELEASPPEG